MNDSRLSWKEIAQTFHIAPASDVLSMARMERYQAVRDGVEWMDEREPPLALLFISHRWETLEHPDPTGRQLSAIQEFLRHVVTGIEVMFVLREERLRRVPSLESEGALQAQEVARRMLGFGPFAELSAAMRGRDARRLVADGFESSGGNIEAFRGWLGERIGVWLDYVCMPQRPLAADELPEFRKTLEGLDALVASSTLIALRESQDDYSRRGWCASEFFLASERSFARGVSFDMDRLQNQLPVVVPALPSASDATSASLMRETYDQDLTAFRHELQAWSSIQGRIVDHHQPAPWEAFRSLQGSGFHASELDPNPFRLVLDAVRDLETELIATWLMSTRTVELDLAGLVGARLHDRGLRCSERADLVFLGLILGGRGWIGWFRPLFREGVTRYLVGVDGDRVDSMRQAFPKLQVSLMPLEEDVRSLFAQARPASAASWHARLASRSGLTPAEKSAVEALRVAVEKRPPMFRFDK